MGAAIETCGCGRVGPCSDNGLCGHCEAFRVGGRAGVELWSLGVVSFEVDLDGPEGMVGIIDHSTGDVIGSGPSEAAAFADAIDTVLGWS